MTDQEQTERGASAVMCRECGEERHDDEPWLHAECADDREANARSDEEKLRADLERVTAERDRLGVLDMVLRERRHHPECPTVSTTEPGGECNCWLAAALSARTQKAEAEQDAMREVCDLAPDALVVLAGLHLGTTWELSTYVKDELARVTPLVRDALAHLDATRKATADATEEGK